MLTDERYSRVTFHLLPLLFRINYQEERVPIGCIPTAAVTATRCHYRVVCVWGVGPFPGRGQVCLRGRGLPSRGYASRGVVQTPQVCIGWSASKEVRPAPNIQNDWQMLLKTLPSIVFGKNIFGVAFESTCTETFYLIVSRRSLLSIC